MLYSNRRGGYRQVADSDFHQALIDKNGAFFHLAVSCIAFCTPAAGEGKEGADAVLFKSGDEAGH